MTNDEVMNIAIKKICGILKSNEVPNANYLIYNGYIMIELYDTVVYFYQLKDVDIIPPISFKLVMNIDKNFVPYDINTRLTILMALYSQYCNVYNNELVAEQSNLQDDPEYSKLLALKSAEGMKFYKLPNNQLYSNTYIPVFNAFPAILKGDTISIKVYKDIYDCYSIVEYNIYRGKIKDYYKLYFRILNL